MTHPRDHILVPRYRGSTAQTDVTKVTLKVRVNGGAAATYTSVSSPAITQYADSTFGYYIAIAANTYSDGDRVDWVWLYNSVVQTNGGEVIGLAEVDGAHYTTARGDKLDDLDATISSRSTYAGADTAGTTSLLARLTAARAAVLDAISLRTGTAQAGAASTITLDAGASATDDLYKGQWIVITSGTGTGQARLITGYVGSTKVATVHRAWATNPDNTSVFYLLSAADINGVVLADTVTTLTNAPPDSSGVTTLLGRLTSARAGFLDFLDAAISSRSTYAGADTAGTTTLLGRLTSGRATNLDNLDATVSSRSTVAAVWAAVADSPGITTLLTRIAAALTITGGKVDVNDKTGFALTAAYDPAKTAAQAGDAMALTSGERTALTAVIWNALTSGMSTVGSIGKLLKDNIDAAISSRLATTGYTAPDNTDIATILTDIGVLLTRLPADVWDELLASHTTNGSAGKALSSAGGAGADPWATPLPGGYTGTEAGEILAQIKATTDQLGTGTVTVRAPITADGGTVEITIGSDYLYADGIAAFDVTVDGLPDLTTATSITVTIDDAITVTATARSATRFTADLPASQTGLLKPRRYVWSADAVFGGHTRPIARGDLIATAKLTAP